MFGTVSRGPLNTRFRLEVMLKNGCPIYQVVIIPNEELARYSDLYAYTLNKMTEKLDGRIKERHQEWMRQ